MNRILKNTMTVGAFTALSRVLGLVREMLQSRFIGAGVEQSAFTLAFALPNMARKLFGEGALTAAFVPVFKGEVEAQAMDSARRLARSVMTMAMLMLVSIVALVLIGLECTVHFRFDLELSDRALLTIRLIKTLIPYMIFICGAAFGMGVLNAMGRFKASSAMPCLLNVFWIGILLWICFHPELKLDQRIHRVSVAILVAGAFQMAFMLWRMHCAGITPGISFKGWKDEKVRLVWRNTAIAAMGAGAVQINYMLDQVLGQLAAPWAAGVIGYAERLMDLPLGVIGVAFGTVLLPTFAGFFSKGDVEGAREAFVSSSKQMLFVMVPAAVGRGVLASEVTAVIYRGGAFDDVAVMRVSRAVAVYAVGLGFFGLQKSLVPWFQAQNDMKTPLKVSVWTVCMNASLNILAVFCLPVEWRHVGLAASTVLCSMCGVAFLAVAAHRRNGSLGMSKLAVPVMKMLVGSVIMAVAIIAVKRFAVVPPLAQLAISMVVGGGVYFASMAAMGVKGVRRRSLCRPAVKND